MGKRNQAENSVTTPMTHPVITDSIEKTLDYSESFVVVREGRRVSDREYATQTDPVAINEMEFWNKVAQNHSYGEPVEIVQYDSKKHRVW